MEKVAQKTRNVEMAAAFILLCCAVLLPALSDRANAAVFFDGMTWYDSHTPSTMFLNNDGHLQWTPYNDHQIIVRIPPQNLSQTGDLVVISYYWLSDGQADIPGCEDCQSPTCNFNKDISCVSGTGDFRVGLFESDGDYITADGMGIVNDIFRGYKGYKFCTQPHVAQVPVRWVDPSNDEPHIAGGFYERDMVDDPRLLSVNDVFDRISMYGGFELPLNQFSLWTLTLERLSPTSVKMSVTLNGITYTHIDTTDTPAVPQPQKIDVFCIEFPNPNPYTKVVLAPPCTIGPANFNDDTVIDARDLRVLTDRWLDGDTFLPVIEPDPDTLLMYYPFDGTLGGNVPNGLLDNTAAFTASIIAGTDPDSSITYGDPNPIYNPAGTSALFNNDNWANYAGDTFLIPDSGGLNFTAFDEFTVALFINPSSAGTGQTRRIFSECIYAYMYLDRDNILHAIRKWGLGDWDVNCTHLTAPIPTDQWSHLAMTWDADDTADKFRLYVNGALAAAAPGTSAPTIDSTAGFAIGGYQREDGSTAQFFAGTIDEFMLFNDALSLQQIACLAAGPQAQIRIPLDSPANLHPDDIIDWKDYAAFALQWLHHCP